MRGGPARAGHRRRPTTRLCWRHEDGKLTFEYGGLATALYRLDRHKETLLLQPMRPRPQLLFRIVSRLRLGVARAGRAGASMDGCTKVAARSAGRAACSLMAWNTDSEWGTK